MKQEEKFQGILETTYAPTLDEIFQRALTARAAGNTRRQQHCTGFKYIPDEDTHDQLQWLRMALSGTHLKLSNAMVIRVAVGLMFDAAAKIVAPSLQLQANSHARNLAALLPLLNEEQRAQVERMLKLQPIQK